MSDRSADDTLQARVRELERESRRRREVEARLAESERLLYGIVAGSSIPTFVINEAHRITHWNRACETLTGLPAQRMIGTRNQWMAFYDHERPVMADLLVEATDIKDFIRYYADRFRHSPVIEGAYEAEGFFPALGTDGKWLFFTAAPLYNARDRVIGAIETLQDMTERKRAEAALLESSERYKRFIDFMPYPIVVFTVEGRVSYVNPMFTEVFGWTLDEIRDRRIPYIPPGLEEETRQGIQSLIENRVVMRHETRRLTRDGRILDVVLRAAIYPATAGEPEGIVLIHRDVTQEKRLARINRAMQRISATLPEYPDLPDLLDYISREIRGLLETEGAAVVLVDEERGELFIPGASYDDLEIEQRVKGNRFPIDEIMAGQVIRNGDPLIVNDTDELPEAYPERDQKLGYQTRNILEVPMRSAERIIGVLAAMNKKAGAFQHEDVELLGTIAGTVALSVENARFSEEVKMAYRELDSLSRARSRMVNHLSHELKTPLSVLSGSLNILESRLSALPEDRWRPTLERAGRNLKRLSEIQEEVDDIVQARGHNPPAYLFRLYEQFLDQMEGVIVNERGDEALAGAIRAEVESRFRPDHLPSRQIQLDRFVAHQLAHLRPDFAHREIEITTDFAPAPPVKIPAEPLMKTVDGLIRNAVENTPDEGRIELTIKPAGNGVQLAVKDYGVGITADSQRRIFDGFYVTQETGDYSTRAPFDFNAGGKGADLLRMRNFSHRYGFRIEMTSSRCRFIPKESDPCPGRISDCPHCSDRADCLASGGSTFSIWFPADSGSFPG